MEELGLLVRVFGELYYSHLLYIDPQTALINEVLVINKHKTLPNFYEFYLGTNKYKTHSNNLVSLVVLRGNGTTIKVSRDFVTDSNQLYLNGKAAIWFEEINGKAVPKRIAYEVVIR